jgi:hypothetical protein
VLGWFLFLVGIIFYCLSASIFGQRWEETERGGSREGGEEMYFVLDEEMRFEMKHCSLWASNRRGVAIWH